jgi:hypothetical protein
MALQNAIGQLLYRLPRRIRERLPRNFRDSIRHRIGPFAPWEAGFAHTPPVLQLGEASGPPDFVGIGAQRAGTTWWFELITEHPHVYHRATIHKERHYFARFASQDFGTEQIAGYHSWFPRVEGTITGEWTPDYAYQPWVPPLLARAAPRAKLIMLVRDPVERFLSGLAHAGLTSSSLVGDELVEAVARGFYGAALRLWQTAFHADQLLVLQYEKCVESPLEQIKRTYRFLGLADAYMPQGVRQMASRNPADKISLHPDARKRLVAVYHEDLDLLRGLVPDLDVSLWPNFAHYV